MFDRLSIQIWSELLLEDHLHKQSTKLLSRKLSSQQELSTLLSIHLKIKELHVQIYLKY